MGTDLFTSARGPGLIGTLMALVVLVGFGALFLFVFDERLQGGGQTIESVIEDDAKQVSSLNQRLTATIGEFEKTKGFKKIGSELRSKTVRRDALAQRNSELGEKLTDAQEKLAKLDESIRQYKQAYRASARSTMVGREMDELKTLDGKTYTRVKVTAIDPVRMQIRHQGGITGVPLDTLPNELQDYLQLDESEKESRLAKEAVIRESSSKAAQHGKLQHRIGNLQHKLAELNKQRDAADRLAGRASAAIPELSRALDVKRRELEYENNKAITGGISNAPQVREAIRQLESRIRNATSQGPALRAKVSAIDNEIREIESQISSAERELKQRESEASNRE